MTLTLKIFRFNPQVSDDAWWDEFTLQVDPFERLVEVLHEVKWYHDGTLTFRRSCAHGICGSDAMVINGRNALACKVLVKDVAPKVTIEPIRGLPVLKDLIVDMEPFFDGYRAVLPYLVNDGRPNASGSRWPKNASGSTTRRSASSAPRARPRARSSGPTRTYIGPAAIVNAHRFIFDSRDRAPRDRLGVLSEKTGVFRCRTTFNCTEACPRGIEVTKAIQEVKRAILFDRA